MAPREAVARVGIGLVCVGVGLALGLNRMALFPTTARAQSPATRPAGRSPGPAAIPPAPAAAPAPPRSPAPVAKPATADPAGSVTTKPAATAPAAEGPKVWKNSQGIQFVRIEAGEFTMGTTPRQLSRLLDLFPKATAKDFDAEQPAHRVRITKPFEISKYKVTVSQFHAFVEETGYPADPNGDKRVGAPPRPWFPQAEDHPMVNVTWNDAHAFCDWLSAKEGGKVKYRLPTEAEWEYACRAGTETLFPNGDDPEKLALIGNVADASAHKNYPGWSWTIHADDGHVFASPVGIYAPTAWGLYDMIGNVWEWCEDNYDHDYYGTLTDPCVDPTGPPESTMRSVRGSCWFLDVKRCRPADRGGFAPTFRCGFLGFRLVAIREG